jgi:pimeloyl-ACP methyl ester carboxylesterase
MRHLGKTPAFRGPEGAPLPGSIAEVRFLRLGGVDQWVLIRGENIANPPLILLHGGPGMSESGMFRHYNAELEKSFTVVYWDQRGAGKSFAPDIPRSSMNLEQFISDLDELVDYVRKRLGHDKVVVLGHSWGTAFGVLYAARFPQKVAAYVGSAQIGDWPAGEAASYAFARAEAERRGNRRALKALREIGAPPYGPAALMTERTWIQRLTGALTWKMLLSTAKMVLTEKESSIFELPTVYRSFRWTLDAMWNDVSQLNLMKLAPALKVPVFFFLGRKDHWVPPETSLVYFDALIAPSKQLVWFEQSGHEMFADQPELFDRSLVELVRPVATAARGPALSH